LTVADIRWQIATEWSELAQWSQWRTKKPSCRWQIRATRSMPKIAPIRCAYNVVADNNGIYLYSFSCCCVRNLWNSEKFSENSKL